MKRILKYGAVALTVAATSLLTPAAYAEDEVKLRFGSHLTVKHNLNVNAAEKWMAKVTEHSGGQVQFDHFPNSQLGKARDTYKLVQSGALDAGFTLYFTGTLPLMDIPSLPSLYEDVTAANLAWWEVVNKPPMSDHLAELNLKPIMPVMWAPYAISMVDGKPESIDDFANLKLRTTGGLHDQAAAALGIIPVAISASESIEALRKGTVDGYWGSGSSLVDYQLVQVLENTVTNLPLNGWGAIFAMNLSKYEALPEGAQKAIDQASDEMAQYLATYIAGYSVGETWDKVGGAGVNLYEVDADVVAQVSEKLAPITADWLAEQDAAGFPATEVYNQFQEAYQRHLKTN